MDSSAMDPSLAFFLLRDIESGPPSRVSCKDNRTREELMEARIGVQRY